MNKNTNSELIVKSLEKLAQYGDVKITNAIKEYHNGERTIRFSNMPKNQYGKTVYINNRYSHFVTERFKENTPENQVSLAVTLAHEFKRSATSDTLEGETRDLILDDTKIIESFALSYGEGIYKKFPEYGILHYIKKIFGETELKDFADYAFDSSGSYWKVNDKGDLIDDGNVSQVKDINDNVIYSGSKGRQGTLQEWLGSANAFTALMQPAGYEWNGTEKKWTKNPGKITHSVIEQAYKDGKLTDDQYNLIRCAAGLVARNSKEEKASLFVQVLRDYQKAEQIRTQIQIDMANRAWEWIKKKYKEFIGISQIGEKTDLFNQLNEKYEKVKEVKYSNSLNDIKYSDQHIPLESSEYYNCISFVCYMYNIPANYSVKNFEKYTQFTKLTNITNVNQLKTGDVITWEYESGVVDSDKKPIYEYHASIWKGDGEIWECMDPKEVRTRNYKKYYDYMNSHDMTIKTIKYFRYEDK